MGGYALTYLSLGAGVQSSFLAVACALGKYGFPPVDFAIFADTQDEPREVYEHLWRLAEWLAAHGVPVHVCSAGQLSEDNPKFLRIPAWGNVNGRESPIRRQCTWDYKIAPIERYVRSYLGVRRGARMKRRVRSLHGISLDEVQRMKPSRTPWLDIEYPLAYGQFTRADCLRLWPELCDLPLPPRSACVYCPYHSNAEWRRLRDTDPDAWAFACAYDARIRNSTQAGVQRPVYLHRSLVPLADADIDDRTDQMDLWGNECDGMCGV